MFSQVQRKRWLAYEEDKSRAVVCLLSFSSVYIFVNYVHFPEGQKLSPCIRSNAKLKGSASTLKNNQTISRRENAAETHRAPRPRYGSTSGWFNSPDHVVPPQLYRLNLAIGKTTWLTRYLSY